MALNRREVTKFEGSWRGVIYINIIIQPTCIKHYVYKALYWVLGIKTK